MNSSGIGQLTSYNEDLEHDKNAFDWIFINSTIHLFSIFPIQLMWEETANLDIAWAFPFNAQWIRN